jgi:hypothetical protein
LQIELSEAENRLLSKLISDSGIKTKKDFFNNALTAFNWLLMQKNQGFAVGAFDNETKEFRELVMPVLEHASAAAADPSRVQVGGAASVSSSASTEPSKTA